MVVQTTDHTVAEKENVAMSLKEDDFEMTRHSEAESVGLSLKRVFGDNPFVSAVQKAPVLSCKQMSAATNAHWR